MMDNKSGTQGEETGPESGLLSMCDVTLHSVGMCCLFVLLKSFITVMVDLETHHF